MDFNLSFPNSNNLFNLSEPRPFLKKKDMSSLRLSLNLLLNEDALPLDEDIQTENAEESRKKYLGGTSKIF